MIFLKQKPTFLIFLVTFLISISSYVALAQSSDPQINLTVDGAVSPVTLFSPASYIINWDVSDPSAKCTSSGDWNGPKATPSGSSTFTSLTGNYFYNMECIGGSVLPERYMGIAGGAVAPADSLPGINPTVSIYDVAVQGDYAFALVYDYITCGGGCFGNSVNDWDELVVYDVSNLESPQIVSRTWTGISPNTIVINGDYAYIGVSRGVAGTGYSLEVYNISNPLSPLYVRSISTGLYSRIQELELQGSRLYSFGGNSGDELIIFDVSDPANPVKIGSYDKGSVYFSSGKVSGNYVYVSNYNDKSLDTFDISDPATPVLVDSDARQSAALYQQMAISGNYLYIPTASSSDSVPALLEIFSIADSSNPVLVGTFDLSLRSPFTTWMFSIEVSSANPNILYLGTVYGIVTVDISNPVSPVLVGNSPLDFLGNYTYGFDFYGKYIVSASNDTNGDNLIMFAPKSTSTMELVVASSPPPAGTLFATDCVISMGSSTCDIQISWQGSNTTEPYSLDRFDTTIANPVAENGDFTDSGLSPGNYIYTFRDNSGQLAINSATAACVIGTVEKLDNFGNMSCLPNVSTSTTMSISLSQSLIRINQTVDIIISVDSEDVLNCTLYGASAGSPIVFQHEGSAALREFTYTYTTGSISSSRTIQVDCGVGGGYIVVSSQAEVEVVPELQEV